ncbi:MAG: RNA polymerase sigma factor [Acidimicrobiales bacterium]
MDSYVPPEREAAFQAAYEQHLATVYRYLVSRSPNASDVPDLVAEVFATLWRRADTLPAETELRPWLVGVARRVLSNHRRGARRRERLVLIMAAEPQAVGRNEPGSERLVRALRALPARDREALLLVVWDDLGHEEAAKALGCSRNALDMRLHRARRRLAREIGPETEGPAASQALEELSPPQLPGTPEGTW